LVFNNITSDFYIGSAISKNEQSNRLYISFRNHFLNTKKVSNIFLQNSMKKYGKQHFSFHILSYTDTTNTRLLEQQYIEQYQPKFNFLAFGVGTINYKHNDEIKLKMSLNFGRKNKAP